MSETRHLRILTHFHDTDLFFTTYPLKRYRRQTYDARAYKVC